MEKLKSGFVLEEGEQLVMELEAELWATSQNPIAKLLGKIAKFCALLIGNKRLGFIVITNKRVVEINQMKVCWVLNVGKEVKYVLPSSVKEVGYIQEGSFCGCFCQSYYLYYESFTQRTQVLLPANAEQEAQAVVSAFYKAISSVQ
ncbi:MAG: hypothetical protein IKK40_04490 [Bacteroidales bacterium]|nr:hypothetical protein [Bacteroidales bacterium]MBR6266373.1 hypothetical protein [Bacteroidales bacterium]